MHAAAGGDGGDGGGGLGGGSDGGAARVEAAVRVKLVLEVIGFGLLLGSKKCEL